MRSGIRDWLTLGRGNTCYLLYAKRYHARTRYLLLVKGKIRSSLELQLISDAAVTEVRAFLKSDTESNYETATCDRKLNLVKLSLQLKFKKI